MLLALLDQVHGLRHVLRSLAAAIDELPLEQRVRVRNAYRRIADR